MRKVFAELFSNTADWRERLNIMEGIYSFYKNYIISNNLFPELDFSRVDLTEMPLHDNEFYIAKNILDNPDWRSEQTALMEKTLKASFKPEASRWVGWWGVV